MPAADYSGAGIFLQGLQVAVQEAAQVFAAARVAKLAQGLGFDLTDTLTGHVELLAHFLKGVVGVHVDTEAHA